MKKWIVEFVKKKKEKVDDILLKLLIWSLFPSLNQTLISFFRRKQKEIVFIKTHSVSFPSRNIKSLVQKHYPKKKHLRKKYQFCYE